MFVEFDPLRELALANAAHRHTDPGLQPPSGTLLCTGDGIFLWPGSPLLIKQGGRFVLRPRDRIYDLVCRLHGPRAAWTPLLSILERPADLLTEDKIDHARACLRRLTLPPLSRAGVDLMRAIAKRLQIDPLDGAPGTQDGTGLRPDLARALAQTYDAVEPALWLFRKTDPASDFDGRHPRLEGPPNAGWFATTASAAGAEIATPQRFKASAAAIAAATPSANHQVAFIGDQQCVTLVRALAGTPRTAEWRPGGLVEGAELPRGTAIATFGPDGRYTNQTATAHAAIYLYQTAAGIRVLEQYANNPPHEYTYPFKSGKFPVNDGRNYYVIEAGK